MRTFENIAPETAEKWLAFPGDWRRPRVEENYEILWDRARSYGQLWPRPTPQEVVAFYQTESYYTHRKTGAQINGKVQLDQRLMNKLSWLVDAGVEPDKDWWSRVLGDKGLRVLEIGCGSGSNLSLLKSLGHNVVGVEPDPNALKVARDAGHLVYNGTAESLPINVADSRFDVVIFMHVLEHCVNPFQAVKSAVGVLNSDGKLIAEVPNNACAGVNQFGPLWHWLDVPRHLNFFTADSLCDLIRSAGFKVDDLSFRGYCRQFSPGWKAAQREIANAFEASTDKRISYARYWLYLIRTAWARDARKYDSVRVVGRRLNG